MTPRRRLAAAIVFCGVTAYAGRMVWLGWPGRTLVCAESEASGQAILLDNFDSEYGLFKRAAELQRTHVATRVFVPVISSKEEDAAAAAHEVAAAFVRLAGLVEWDLIRVEEKEPISLHAAYQVRDFLLREHISSVTLVSPGFRSRRSELVYRSVLGARGITMACLPVFRTTTPETWTNTWHGIQDVGLQFLKLQYYRFWVIPMAQDRP